MFVKKLSFVLLCALLIINFFAIGSSAARAGEFETGFVEFKALTPDGFAEPIEIVLIHKTEDYELRYYLYKINDYFSNEQVPLGDYDVTVNIANDEEVYGYIHEDGLYVESVNLAVPFRIIVDGNSLEGDVSDNEVINTIDVDDEKGVLISEGFESNNEEKNNTIEENDTGKGENVKISDEKQTGRLLSSLIFSAVMIVAGGLVVLWLKKR